MASSLKLLTKSELAIFEDIIECPRCLTHENLCNSHAKDIKKIFMRNVKNEIDKLITENNS